MRCGIVVGVLLLVSLGSGCRYEPAASPIVRYQAEPYRPPARLRAAPTPPRPAVTRVKQVATPPRVPASWSPAGGRISSRWTTIVIHHSATECGCAAIFDKAHKRQGWDELGYHFVIGNGNGAQDGAIEVGSRWRKQKHGAHCKTPGNYYNDHGIGICLVGDFTDRGPSRRQLASLVKLLDFLCRECNIPPARVTGHRHVTQRTACPGSQFPLSWVRSQLSSRTVTASSLP